MSELVFQVPVHGQSVACAAEVRADSNIRALRLLPAQTDGIRQADSDAVSEVCVFLTRALRAGMEWEAFAAAPGGKHLVCAVVEAAENERRAHCASLDSIP